MAERCAGCTNKFKFREKPTACVKCHRNFCSLCIPVAKHKKKTPVIRDTCIYCTRRLQEAMKEQEAEVLEQFPDRFYHSPHLQPTLHTKLRVDEEKLKASGGRSGGEPRLTDEDRKLEERLRKLKESQVPTTPASSETVLHARLAKLREEPHDKNRSEETNEKPPSSLDNQPQLNGGLPQPSNKTQAEQADDLVDQVSDMVKLDSKVDQNSQHLNVEDSVNTFLSGLEIQLEDEDPNKLLEDFKKFQLKEEHKALAKAASHEVQAVVEKAKELQQQQEEDESGKGKSETFITPYPQLPESMETQVLEEDKISQVEITKVLEAAKKEMEQEEKEQKDIDQFISEASKQLSDLRGNGRESDCEVRSKLEHRQEPHHRLDFSWDHFGASGGVSNLELPTDSGLKETAAHQLGITLSGSSGEWDNGDDVAGLIEQTMAEVALDRKLEEKGLYTYLDVPEKAVVSSKSSEKGGATASAVGGACAATNYPVPTTSGWEIDPDDLPWCCICNSDAHIRCFDCDNDLYCTQCFSEGHEQFGLFDHKYAPFDPSSSRVM